MFPYLSILGEEMSEQRPIDNEYINDLKQLSSSIEEFKQFIADMKSYKQEMQDTYKNYTESKEKIDNAISNIQQSAEIYNNSKSEAEQKLAAIQTMAQNAIDAKDRIDTSELHIASQKGKIDSDTQTIEVTKNRFSSLKEEAEKIAADLSSHQTDLQSQITKIEKKANVLKEYEAELKRIQESAEKSKNQTEEAHQNIQNQQQNFQQSIDNTSEKLRELTNKQEELKGLISGIEDAHVKILEAHNELLTDSNNSLSISSKIKELYEENKKFHEDAIKANNKAKENISLTRAEEQKKFNELHHDLTQTFGQLHAALSEKINSLLPGAGAAGLASSYYEAKMKYSMTNDLSSSNQESENKKLRWHMFIPQACAFLFNFSLFIIPLVVLIVKFHTFEIPAGFEAEPYAILLYKIVVNIPLIAISSYGLILLVHNRRLYEEYNHKQRVMQLYHSFKKEIDSTSNNDLKIKLLNVMLDIVKDKPKLSRGKSVLQSLQDQAHKISDRVAGG